MLKTFLFVTSSIVLAIPSYAHAFSNSCEIQVAISSPPVSPGSSVALNVSNNEGFSRSTILNANDGPRIIGKLICSPHPYTVSATLIRSLQNQTPPLGECTLRAGKIKLQEADSSIAVVFPNDFVCSNPN